MVTRKSQQLKAKLEKLEKDLAKIKSQKAQLAEKEKDLLKQQKAADAEYILALMAESNRTREEFEQFAQVKAANAENGGDAHVPTH
ncbi:MULTISPECIES: hypothetical protein [Streptococcus]|uniref:Uncharacterized protein n=1 Tax=Streptococcus sanguinis TaxID=1305 RepID=A0AAJ5NHL1_STRSA|nr:hypothetical protein [Streptococcus sanguinis]VDY71565.1 Uncharacterised protein [Streptococcus sanguinis]